MTNVELTKETQADEKRSFDEYRAVANALQPYITAAKTGDGDLVRTVFYDHAHILGAANGEIQNVDADTFKGVIDQVGPSPDVQHHIAWIDITGPAAAAKVEFINWSGNRFTDFLFSTKKTSSGRSVPRSMTRTATTKQCS